MEFAKPRLQGGTARNLSDLSGRTLGMWLGGRPLIADPRRGLADPLVAHAARLRPGLAGAPGFRPPQQPPQISRPSPGKHLVAGPLVAHAARLRPGLACSQGFRPPQQRPALSSPAQARTLPVSRTITARVISSTCGPPPMYAYAWAISVSHRCWAECPNSARTTSSSRSSPKNVPCSS